MVGRHTGLHSILDYCSPRLPSAASLGVEDEDGERPLQYTRPFPFALIAAHPRARLAVEWHEPRPHEGQSLILVMMPSPVACTQYAAASGGHGLGHSGFTGSLSSTRADRLARTQLRRIPMRREIRFPRNVVTPALAHAVWWLTRTQSRHHPLALRLIAMYDDAVPLKASPLLPLVASIELSGRRADTTTLESGSLVSLEELHITNCSSMGSGKEDSLAKLSQSVNAGTLTALTLSSCVTANLEWIEQLRGLTFLNLHQCELLEDFSPVGTLKHLTWLDLSLTECTEFDWLSGCTALEHLNLSGCMSFDSFAPLERLAHLDTLVAEGTGVQSLESLVMTTDDPSEDPDETESQVGPRAAQSLRRLILEEAMIETLQGLDKLPNLEVLDVSGTELLPGGRPSAVQALRVSSATMPNEGDLSWIAMDFPVLRVLDLSRCSDIDDLAPLAALRQTLRVLDMHLCETLEYIPYSVAGVLEELDITGCHNLHNPEKLLSRCKALRVLRAMALDSLTSLTWVDSCPFLEELHVADCDSLSSLAGIEAVAGTLRVLNISDTAVTSVLPALPTCTRLESLQCNGCRLDEKSVRAVRGMGFAGPDDYQQVQW